MGTYQPSSASRGGFQTYPPVRQPGPGAVRPPLVGRGIRGGQSYHNQRPRSLESHATHPQWLTQPVRYWELDEYPERPPNNPVVHPRPSLAGLPRLPELPLSLVVQGSRPPKRQQVLWFPVDGSQADSRLQALSAGYVANIRYVQYEGDADNGKTPEPVVFPTLQHFLVYTKYFSRRQFRDAQRVLEEGHDWPNETLLLESRRSDWMGANAWKNELWRTVAPRLAHAYLRRREVEDTAFRHALASPLWVRRQVKAACFQLEPPGIYGDLLQEVLEHYNWEVPYRGGKWLLIGDSLLLPWRHQTLGLFRTIAIPGLNVTAATWLAQALATFDLQALAFLVGTNDCQRDPPPGLVPQLFPPPSEVPVNPIAGANPDESLRHRTAYSLPVNMVLQGQLLLDRFLNLHSVRFCDLPPRPDQSVGYDPTRRIPPPWRRGTRFQRDMARTNDILHRILNRQPGIPISSIPIQYALLPVWQTYGYDRNACVYAMHPNANGNRQLQYCLEHYLSHE